MAAHKSDQLNQEIDEFLSDHPKIDEFEVLVIDICGHFFGKRYPISQLQSSAKDGLSFPMSMFVLSTLGETLPGLYYGDEDGDPDARFYLVPGSLSLNNWGNKPRAQVMATSHYENEPTFFEPRNLLSKVLQLFKQKNWHPMVAFELEFFLFNRERDEQGLIKIVRNPKTGRLDTPTVLSSTRISDFEAVIDEIISACNQQNIETGAISSEMGAGQFEINFNHHDDVLRAADETCLFKRAVIEVAKKHGMMASFMAKPLVDQPGNGLHMHISVIDDDGNNVFDDGEEAQPCLLHAIGGLLETMPAAMSFWAPNINSYRRYIGNNCAPVSRTWGYENRNVAFRIPLAKDRAWRVENRVPGADANPYLAMAVTLAGMLHGINNKIDPGLSIDDIDEEEKDEKLPLFLFDALAVTLADDALNQILGKDFIQIYCRHRDVETDAFQQIISAREYDWYL